MWAGTFIINVLFYCLAVVFVKINYVVVFLMCVSWYMFRSQALSLPACRILTVHSIISNVLKLYSVLFNIGLFYMFKMLLDFCAVCQTYTINKENVCLFPKDSCYFTMIHACKYLIFLVENYACHIF